MITHLTGLKTGKGITMAWKTDKNGEKLINRFVSNVKFVCKEQDKKIGDLEDYVGVSKGYFSRVGVSVNNINLITAVRASEYLGITLDDLVKGTLMVDYRIQMLEEELQKLRKQKEQYG